MIIVSHYQLIFRLLRGCAKSSPSPSCCFWVLHSPAPKAAFDGCDPDVLLAVDDNYIIQEEDLSSFTANLLSNDIIGIDAFVSIEGLPPLFPS